MKQNSKDRKHKRLKQSRQRCLIKATKRAASKKRNKRLFKNRFFLKNKIPSIYEIVKRRRKDVWKRIIKEYTFKSSTLTIDLEGEIGIETGNIDEFISIGKLIVDSNARILKLNVNKCTRLWPSAITLICSFHQWRNLIYSLKCKKHQKSVKPIISANRPYTEQLDNYLTYCGFYDYVGYPQIQPKSQFPESDVVKIELERDNDKIEIRCRQIMKLIKEKSTLPLDDIERVQCMVIPEIINNVTEHGQNCIDKGWWMLAQYHKNHKIISICIADNGLGIRNNLLTGPQRDEIIQRHGFQGNEDDKFIELAFTEQVSGATEAKLKNIKSGLHKRYPKGSNRGNGLKRVKKTCSQCLIKLSVFSQRGYVMYDEYGSIVRQKTFDKRIFGGTMYNLIIPAR